MRREAVEQVSGDAAARALDAVVGHDRRAAEGAVEVEVLEPGVEAVLVEHVAAGEPAHGIATGEAVEADNAVRVGILGAAGVGAAPVYAELVAEDNEAGEAGADDVVESGDKVAGGRRRGEEAEVVQDGEDEGVEVTDAFSDEHRHDYEDRFGGDVGELVL